MDTDKTKTVWIVDDEPDLANSVASNLKDKFSIRVFSDPKAALEEFDHVAHPHVLISDLRMPEIDGHTLAKEARERGVKSKIIMTSAYSEKIDAIRALHVGAFGFLEKPFTVEDLKMMVSRAADAFEELDLYEKVQKVFLEVKEAWKHLSDAYYERIVLLENSSSLRMDMLSTDEKAHFISILKTERLAHETIAKLEEKMNAVEPWMRN